MKAVLLSSSVTIALLASGCTGTTPIKNVALPPVTTIAGTITRLDENGFTLADSSGAIFVRARLPGNKRLDVSLQEKAKVYGNLQGGRERIFDGYVIEKPSGERIIVTNPAPHFGFIIQGSFQ